MGFAARIVRVRYRRLGCRVLDRSLSVVIVFVRVKLRLKCTKDANLTYIEGTSLNWDAIETQLKHSLNIRKGINHTEDCLSISKAFSSYDLFIEWREADGFSDLGPINFWVILSGPRSHATVSFIPTVHNINVDTSTQALDEVVCEFWNLESISIQLIQEKKGTCNSELLTNFHQSFEIIDGRRVIKLPWKPEVQLSSNNYEVAIRRFNSLTRQLHADTVFKQEYSERMQDYIDKKQVGIVSHEAHNKERLFYSPHHAVKKITNEETKCRIAFDASSHSPGHPSLNDALEIGPNLLPDIMAMLLRFHLSKIAYYL
ncbi:hypothetical protein HNY73_000647 [Argiope bruennichi]|uniref:Uncharacterized protein n=1 Tax=Argiope bruennichi TaxID=94029 RepID=A0A8T0G2H5_ARGBR|nr:hypothetical protein HNY73_000647 [Argiope bruennichi]